MNAGPDANSIHATDDRFGEAVATEGKVEVRVHRVQQPELPGVPGRAPKRMVERGMGLAFLPHLAVARELRRRTLVAMEIVDAEPLARSLDVIHPRQRPLSPEALALLQALRAAVGEAPRRPRRR